MSEETAEPKPRKRVRQKYLSGAEPPEPDPVDPIVLDLCEKYATLKRKYQKIGKQTIEAQRVAITEMAKHGLRIVICNDGEDKVEVDDSTRLKVSKNKKVTEGEANEPD